MLSRSLALASIARKSLSINSAAISAISRRFAHHQEPPVDWKPPTMDDMIVPCGDWKEDYDNKQRRYNLHLIVGTAFFIITMFTGIYSGAFDLYITPPQKPKPPKSAEAPPTE